MGISTMRRMLDQKHQKIEMPRTEMSCKGTIHMQYPYVCKSLKISVCGLTQTRFTHCASVSIRVVATPLMTIGARVKRSVWSTHVKNVAVSCMAVVNCSLTGHIPHLATKK